MRILVVAEDIEVARTRGAELSRAGFEVAGHAGRRDATGALRRLRADAVLILDDGVEALDAASIRALARRMRLAAEASLPLALLLTDGSVWLRARLAADLGPTVALRLHAPAREVGEALERLRNEAGPLALATSATPRLDVVRREVSGPLGAASLTPSELTIAWELATAEGGVVPYDTLAKALWGAGADRAARAALRGHLHTLRAKLRRADAAIEVENRPGVGYRLATRLIVRAPRG